MSEKWIKDAVYSLIGEHFSIEKNEITDDLGPGSLSNWDSINHMQLVQKLEAFFSISFNVYDIMSFNTIADVCRVIGHILEKQE